MISPRLALRTLFRTPFVTVVAIVSLALGVGANAGVFSIFNQVLLKPLPVPEPGTLVNLAAPGPKPGSTSCNTAGPCETVFSYPMFRDLERAQTSFTGIAAHRLFSANLAYAGRTTNGDGVLVSGSYFRVLGIQPALGRLLRPGDDPAPGESHVVVLSYRYWQRDFDGRPDVVDKVLVVNGEAMTIVGVAPRGFDGTTFGPRPLVFAPITMIERMRAGSKEFDSNRRSYWAYLFARLKPGVPVESARVAINAPYRAIVNEVEAPLQKGMSDRTMAQFRKKQVIVTDGARGQSQVNTEGLAPLSLLLGVTGFVLLIACANIANLLLARGAARSGEMAIRLSIGAGRGQLVAQLLAEACLLAAAGGVAGLLVARWTLALMIWLLPGEAGDAITPSLDLPVLLFAAVLTLGTGLLFGLFPALHSTRPNLLSALKGQSGQPSGARAASRFRTSLAVAQIALSMALLVAAGLFTKSLFNVGRVDLGLDPDNVVTFAVSPELNGYTPERSRQLFERLEAELAALPGVRGATAAMVPLLAGSNWNNGVWVEGFEVGPDTNNGSSFNEVGPGFCRTLGIPLLAGREFTPSDAIGTPSVAIVNEAFAKKFNLGRSAVGKRMGVGSGEKMDIEIVGLAQNAKYSEVKRTVPPQYFLPYRQDKELGSMTFYVRTSLDAEALVGTVSRVVARLDPNLPIESLRTLQEQVRQNVFIDRFITVLSASFAILATLLAAVGLYGVLAYTLTQRIREIGLRMALGAAPDRIRKMVLWQTGLMTLIGGTIGLLGALGLGRAAESLLFEMKGSDPMVLAVAAVLLAVVAMAAGLIPAHRASQIDPIRALRYE
jgi:predicted permease